MACYMMNSNVDGSHDVPTIELARSAFKMTDMNGSSSTISDIAALHKEWDEISCPICMDHPHNAVLLICSSHEKGCRSYICDTSYRHSNCLDRFKKLKVNDRDSSSQQSSSIFENSDTGNLEQRDPHNPNSESILGGLRTRGNLVEAHEGNGFEENNEGSSSSIFEELEEINNGQESERSAEAQGEERNRLQESGGSNASAENCLKCPLCRGTVMGWMIAQEARQYLDQKPRACSRESCSFSGNYRELRRHARRVHPLTRPGDVDPSRQRAWRRLEHQREYGDILSAIRSAMPGAIVLGDYVIDNGDGLSRDRESNGSGEGGGPWWTTFFLFHMIGSPIGSLGERRGSSRAWQTHRRSGHRNLWGENLLGLQDDDDDDDDGNLDDDIPIPRRRRRFMRSRPDDEQP
ncbi:uncharacterized protein [Elaeis guineensis]|uniref:Uncharacterized protein LOC105043152 isoform X1 n=3 Tax=Elaeis guineensis var. tenera TaxID=51953 RepID=A0A6J0PH26_ELAGV|nr:uncharacterized protein LOC105043152 isoform X1 [Elaeis guineensis]XP_019705644.1 uncharacterized protein LOC105043152 isoform X1 [Elaeis guineensis]XP_019705645.1 uncharacterized protein LOC105043152 isoform X1 [Elaeis guineensis]XP_019705646.1 uncharacterized protein LOC105043152 isoform X1 [Elaeis guineensis]XP_029119818.1 uncharacterized protein LOC105043152 isoform X1 [Elaeis guineensis]XP_029119819.1 uncharacterized protein LOC105043152 isoform X1 [Elaeis guineensis]